jgi:hypothetical protein
MVAALGVAWSGAEGRARADVRPAVGTVACVPGGVAAIPLMREPGDEWPATIPVRVAGLGTRGVVAWVGVRQTAARHWTRSADQVEIRAIREVPAVGADGPPEAVGTVLALVELPAIPGPLEVNGRGVDAQWIADRPLPERGRGALPLTTVPALDLPDPEAPSEYWRWCLLAEARGERPPPATGTVCERLWARHVAGLWRVGMERARAGSPGIHAELLEALTGTACDPLLPPPGLVAAWIAGPGELRALLSVLLDSSVRPAQVAQSALSWLRTSWPVTVWVEADAGDRVRLAIANPTAGERVVRAAWIGGPDTVPTALVAPPRTVTRHWLERAPLPPSADPLATDRARSESLEIALGDLRRRIPVGPREYAVRPPGLSFGALAPPLTLADAQTGRMAPVPPEWRTSATLRRRMGRWEILVECMRPPGGGATARGAAQAAATTDAGDASDELTLRIGDPEAPLRTVRVSGHGALAVDGGLSDGAAAGFMRWPDRWRARIELPDAWIPAAAVPLQGAEARPLLLSIERSPGGGQPRQTAGLAVPPWTLVAPPVMVDLGTWGGAGAR